MVPSRLDTTTSLWAWVRTSTPVNQWSVRGTTQPEADNPRSGPFSATTTDVALRAFVRERLAHFKCPQAFHFVTELPKTATGKVQKFKLRQQYWQGRERQVN